MAVLIPRHFAKSRKIALGSVLDLESVKVVKPRRRRYTAAELMEGYKPEHRHGEWNLGRPVGKETW
jgi:antitoxin component of MazEF toxin-antitoxin module